MTKFFVEYGLFLAETVTVVVAIALIAGVVFALGTRTRRSDDGQIEVRKLNDRYRDMRDSLRSVALDPALFKRQLKAEHKLEKAKNKQKLKTSAAMGKRIFVVNFHGDIRAHAVHAMREEITAILTVAEKQDEVVVRLESSGGMVHSYGLAAAQLARLRDRGIAVTVCIDKVAASGGYMMACVANRILAAPFALVGSIGVVAQIPNFNRLLKKHDVDFELLTAGQYKRTLTLFGVNTETGRQKFVEELEETHALFKEFVVKFRPSLDVQTVATGEVWYGERALGLGLIDCISTSDAYLQTAVEAEESLLLEIRYVEHKKLSERLGLALEAGIQRGVQRALDQLSAWDWPRR